MTKRHLSLRDLQTKRQRIVEDLPRLDRPFCYFCLKEAAVNPSYTVTRVSNYAAAEGRYVVVKKQHGDGLALELRYGVCNVHASAHRDLLTKNIDHDDKTP